MSQDDGASLIAEYYSVAPQIVMNIEKSNNRGEIYNNILDKYLRKCLQFIESRDYTACKKKYIEMVSTLKKEYFTYT